MAPKPPTLKQYHASQRRRKDYVPAKPGRPKGVQGIMAEYRAMMLENPSSPKVLEKVLDIALNDEHPHQASCLKLIMDRLVPAGAMSNLAGASTGKSAVTINIKGIGESPVTIDGETLAPEDDGWEEV